MQNTFYDLKTKTFILCFYSARMRNWTNFSGFYLWSLKPQIIFFLCHKYTPLGLVLSQKILKKKKSGACGCKIDNFPIDVT